jgi:hypothetical protein
MYLSIYIPIHPFIYLSIYLSIYGSTVLLLDFGRFFSFLILYTVGRKAATYTQDSTNTEYTHTQTSMPQVGFEPKIPVFERAKTVHALDCADTVIGQRLNTLLKLKIETVLHASKQKKMCLITNFRLSPFPGSIPGPTRISEK